MKRTIKILLVLLCLASPAYASKQVIIGRMNVNLNAASTTYMPPMCGGGTTAYCNHFTTLSHGEGIWPTGGTISDFCVELSGTPDNGVGTQSYAFTVYVNGSGTTQTVTLSETTASGCTVGAAASVSAAQGVTIETIPSGTPTVRLLKYSYVFNSTTTGESVFVMAGGSTNMNAAQNRRYSPFMGHQDVAVSNDRRFTASTAGTFKSLYCRIGADPDNGVGVDSYILTLQKDASQSALTCTVADGITTCNDLSNTVTVAAADTYAFTEISSGTPTATTGSCGMVFLADTAGEWIVPATLVGMSSTATHYGSMQAGTSNATETNRDALSSIGFTVTNIYVTTSAATAAGSSLAFTIREETTTSMGTTCTVGAAATTCNGGTDSTVTALNTYATMAVPSTTPGALNAWIGYTGFISEGAAARRMFVVM